jgi:hypothetical protein
MYLIIICYYTFIRVAVLFAVVFKTANEIQNDNEFYLHLGVYVAVIKFVYPVLKCK